MKGNKMESDEVWALALINAREALRVCIAYPLNTDIDKAIIGDAYDTMCEKIEELKPFAR